MTQHTMKSLISMKISYNEMGNYFRFSRNKKVRDEQQENDLGNLQPWHGAGRGGRQEINISTPRNSSKWQLYTLHIPSSRKT